MLKTIRSWIFWWNRCRTAKKAIKQQIAMCKQMGPAEPPTPKQIEAFKNEFDMGWNDHMVQKVESRKTYFEQYITDPRGVHTQVWAK